MVRMLFALYMQRLSTKFQGFMWGSAELSSVLALDVTVAFFYTSCFFAPRRFYISIVN